MSKELKVGLFVLVSLLIFLGTLVYVDQLSGDRVLYKAYFRYAGGIDPGSQVRFGGMKVGSITAIREWHQDPTKIEVLMEVKAGVPVNADSVAMLTSLSPLGDKYLEISTGSNKAPRLSPGATIPSKEPVSLDDLARQANELMPTVQAAFQDVQKNVDQVAGNARLVLANIQSITGPQNQRNLTLLLANARELLDKESAQIDGLLKKLDQVSSQASDTLTQAGGTLTQANSTFSELQATARTANDTLTNANKSIGEIRDPFKTDLVELQRTMTDTRRLIGDLNTMVSANRDNVDDTLENFRAASENLRELTRSVRQRPWILLRGRPAADRSVPVATPRP